MGTDLIIIVDTREKRPMPLPAHLPTRYRTYKVHVVREALPTGDYLLEGFRSGTLIERKGSLREVAQNVLSEDRRRFLACLDRLAEASRPVLFLEGCPASFARLADRDPTLRGAIDELLLLLDERRIELLMLPTKGAAQRRQAGEWIVRRLLSQMRANHGKDQQP